MFVFIFILIYVFTCMYVYHSHQNMKMYLYIYIHIYTYTDHAMSLTPLLSNLAVSTTNAVNLMFNSIKMATATN